MYYFKSRDLCLDKYSMGLKYCISSKQFDARVLENQNRGPEIIEKTMGLLWNVLDDTITATPKYNLFWSARGIQLGTPFVGNVCWGDYE